MRRWFLSYHTPDQKLAERLKEAIERKDSSSRVFLAPTHLRAGGLWTVQLAREIAEADAFVLLVGEHGLGDWQLFEYDEALDKHVKTPNFPIILMLLQGQIAPGLPFLKRFHWIISPDPSSEKDAARLLDGASGDAVAGELWRYTSPYRGLAAMEAKDSDYFFGRTRETVEILNALGTIPEKLAVLIGNSGVGKSSLAQAGVLAALKRQAWPDTSPDDWPQAFGDSRRWCFLSLRPGTEPVRALIEAFLDTWQLDRVGTAWPALRAEWVDALLARKLTLGDLLDQTGRRYDELGQPRPPTFLLYIDQGEELYVRSAERERQCFSELVAAALSERRLRAVMSLRADFLGELQKDELLQDSSHKIEVPPLRETQLREVVSRPAALLGARFESDHLAADIARRTAEESSRDAGALPLLSYLLDDMWKSKDPKWDGVLRLQAPAVELGRVLVDRADSFIVEHPGAEEALRRIFTLKLATVREDGEPTRRRAFRHEFSREEWRLVSELADHPNRLLVTAKGEIGETYAEVAHEAIFRRWDKLREWIAAEREFLAWRSGLEVARRAWQATASAGSPRQDALLMGAALTQAQSWHLKRAEDLPGTDCSFIEQSIAQERKAQARARRVQMLVYVLLVGVIAGLIGWMNETRIIDAYRVHWTEARFAAANIQLLTADAERALRPDPKQSFWECIHADRDICPEMVVVPAGAFMMGSLSTDRDASESEFPRHRVTISKPFAVSKYALTFAEWDTCVAYGDCPPRAKVLASTRAGAGSGDR